QYGFLKKTTLNDSDIEIVEMASRDLLTSLSPTIERHGGRVDNGLIEKVFVALEQNELLPVRIKAQSVRGMLGPVFGKFLAGNHLANSASLSLGLQADHITRIDEVVKDWAEGHRLVLAIMGNVEFLTVNQVKTALSQIPNRNKDEISERAHIQMLDLILRGRPLARDIEGRTYVLPSNLIPGYRVADLERLNLNRVLSSLILKGYARQTPRAGNAPQITSQEAQEVFSDVKSLGRDLGFVDVRSLQSGTRTFMEMGVFTSVSDGDQFISLREAVEWLEIVASSSKLADHIHSQLVGACGVGPLGVFGDMRLSAQCFRERLLPLLRSTLSHLPNVVRTINQAERSRQAERLIRSIEESVRPLGMTDLPIELSELRAMIPVLHYAESLFARFDVNQTGVLEDEEVWSIFPLIRPFIRTVATGVDLSAGEERAIFSWIVRKGEPPSTTMGGKISLKMYQARLGFLEETATVETILQILGSFQKVGRESKDRAVLELYRLHAAAWEKKLGSGDEEIMNRTRNLLQCADEAKDSFARLIQMRRADIFSRDERQDDEEQAVAFLTRFKTLVQGDPQLQLLCQAF
ncbi:MAG: hypothetical protein RBT63_11705, partial [Bdellovibrionales bacterium]|nr:hypothetical protein [Bdellovibrionales bacterium]